MFSPKLLCLSHDPRLLETRLRVLARHYSVTGATDLGQLQLLASSRFDLVIICHTIQFHERAAAIQFIRTHWPQARLLGIARPNLDAAIHDVDAQVKALDGPESLLSCIQHTLREPPFPSTGSLTPGDR